MEKFSARLPRSRELSQPALSYEHVENFTKDLEVRRDLGHRAQMKRFTYLFLLQKMIMSTSFASIQPKRS